MEAFFVRVANSVLEHFGRKVVPAVSNTAVRLVVERVSYARPLPAVRAVSIVVVSLAGGLVLSLLTKVFLGIERGVVFPVGAPLWGLYVGFLFARTGAKREGALLGMVSGLFGWALYVFYIL